MSWNDKNQTIDFIFFLTILLLCNVIPENLSYFYVLTLLKMSEQYARKPHFVLTLRYLHIIYVYNVYYFKILWHTWHTDTCVITACNITPKQHIGLFLFVQYRSSSIVQVWSVSSFYSLNTITRKIHVSGIPK